MSILLLILTCIVFAIVFFAIGNFAGNMIVKKKKKRDTLLEKKRCDF